jgi:hypothetical protein
MTGDQPMDQDVKRCTTCGRQPECGYNWKGDYHWIACPDCAVNCASSHRLDDVVAFWNEKQRARQS